MNDVNLLAIVVVAVAVLVVSTVWYIAFGKQLAELSPAYADAASNARPPAWKVAVDRPEPRCRLRGGRACRAARYRGLEGRAAAWTRTVDRIPRRALDGRDHVGKGLLEARRHPCRRLVLKLLVISVVVSVWRKNPGPT